MLHTVATWFHRNNTITCHWVGSGQTTKHNDDSFTGVNRLKSCVCTRCFQFDICRVGFFLGYVDGLVQQRRNSGAFSNGEHYVFLALTHRNIHHGTRSRVYHTLTTVDDLVPQGANASADILNATFYLIFFFGLGTGNITLFLTSHNFFKLYMLCIFQNMTKKYDNGKIRIAQPRRPGFK